MASCPNCPHLYMYHDSEGCKKCDCKITNEQIKDSRKTDFERLPWTQTQSLRFVLVVSVGLIASAFTIISIGFLAWFTIHTIGPLIYLFIIAVPILILGVNSFNAYLARRDKESITR